MDKKINTSSDLWGLVSLLKHVVIASLVTILIIVGLFIVYLVKQKGHTSVDTVGVYNLVNSENGEIIATDLTPEDINKIMELLNNGEN